MNEDVSPSVAPEEPEAVVNVHKEVYEWIQCVVVALLLCVLIFMFFARVIDVQGRSMEPTLIEGDKIVITRLAGDYERGDIVVLRKEAFRIEPIVKRVIAVGGDTIDIDFTAGVVYVNGQPLSEPYVNELTYDREDFEAIKESGEYEVTETGLVIPDNCLFVMGDNRNNSSDSRKAAIACVDERYVLGKVIFRIWPISKLGAMYGWEY